MSSVRPTGARTSAFAIVNARIWTAEPRRPWADALLVSGDRLAAVGSSAEVRKLTTAATHIWDAGRRMIVPGLMNAHGGVTLAGSLTRRGDATFVVVDRDLVRLDLGTTVPDAVVHLAVVEGQVIHGSMDDDMDRGVDGNSDG